MVKTYRFLVAISRGLRFGILSLAVSIPVFGSQQPVAAQGNAGPKPSLRVCLDVGGSKDSGEYDELIHWLSGTVKSNNFATVPTIVTSVPLFKEVPARCHYILRLGRVETADWTDAGYHNNPAPRAQSEVAFSLFRAGSDKAIMHDKATVIWNASTQGQESKLIPIVAQRTLKAIERDQRRSAKPSP